MKPPPRKRVKRSRELAPVPEPPGRTVCKWPKAEKKRLLFALSQLCTRDTLDPERVRGLLPTRSAAEIKWVLEALKEKVILFAKTKYHEERREERRARKPLDMWIQEATALTGTMEDLLSLAFTQVLTVAAVEPRAQHHSQALHKEEEKTTETAQCPLVPGNPPPQSSVRTPKLSAPSRMTQVSFEKIYRYLGTLQKPSEHCKLTPMESAIVLDLLMSLPEELLLLDCDKLSQHLSQVYPSLSSGADSSEGLKTQQPSGVDQQTPQPTQSSARTKNPLLNPFQIPINLLSRNTQRTGT